MVGAGAWDESHVSNRSLTSPPNAGYAVVMLRHVATLGISLLLLALLAITALSLGHRREAPLRIGVSPWPGAEALFLAHEHGLLAAAGLRVDLVEYASFGDVATAFAHGDVDALLGTSHEVVTVCARSQRRPVIVRATDQSLGGYQILLTADLAGLADLAGRRVGVEIASIGIEVLVRALATVGLTTTDVVIVPGEPAGIPEDFRAGRIDAAVSYQPYADTIAASGGRGVFTSADLKTPIVTVFAIEAQWLAQQPQAAAAFDRAFTQAVDWIAANPAAAAAEQGARLGLSAEDFAAQAKQVRLLDGPTAAELLHSGQVEAMIHRSAGLLRTMGAIGEVDLTGVVADGD